MPGLGASRDIHAPGLPLYVVAYGVLATAWMSLFFAQTLLIASGRDDGHRTVLGARLDDVTAWAQDP